MSVTKYIVINETTYNDSVATELLSYWSTRNKALDELASIADEHDIELDLDESSFSIQGEKIFIEFYVAEIEEDKS